MIDSDAVDVLLRHDWPGNIRELYHTLERVAGRADHITARLLSAEMAGIAAKKAGHRRLPRRHGRANANSWPTRRPRGNKSAAAEQA